MIADLIGALAVISVSQELHVQPTDCSVVSEARYREQDLGELTTSGSYLTCPPEGPGRHLYRFNGFEGERVSFSFRGYTVGGPSDLNLELTVTGPRNFRASGMIRGGAMLLTLPRTGEYQLVIENRAPPGVSNVPYMMQADEHEALWARSDCTRLSLSGGEAGIEISSHFLRPGGSEVVRPSWRMRGRTYDLPNECLTNWRVSSPLARLSRNTVGNWTLILDPRIAEGTRVVVTATAGEQEVMNAIEVDSTENTR